MIVLREYRNEEGKLHRENDLPALEFTNGDKCWLINGELHRESNPAIVRANGSVEYWFRGKWFFTKNSSNLEDKNTLEKYILEVLTALGQMDHISSRVACKCGKEHIVGHNGVMSMSVEKRRELLSRGWEML